MPHRAARGLTLVELLIAASLLALVGGAFLAAFGGAVRTWRAAMLRTPDWQVRLVLERMDADVAAALPLSSIGLAGDETGFSLPPRVREQDANGRTVERPGRKAFRYDSATGRLTRSLSSYSRALDEAAPVPPAEVGEVVLADARFAYGAYDPERRELVWHETWVDPSALPNRIRVRFTYGVAGRRRTVERILTPMTGASW